MNVWWVRGKQSVRPDRPDVWFCLGVRGSGKSSLLEHIAEGYLSEGNVVLDLFGSRDGESLSWLRSPHAKDKRILLLRGENVDVDTSFDVKLVEKLTLKDVENYDLIISASPCYLNMDQEFYNAAKLTDLLYKRLSYKRLVYLLSREASNFFYSRLKITQNQVFAKAQMVYMLKEARHCGVALGLDSVRFMAIDIDIRSLADFTFFKSVGIGGLAKDLRWLYSFYDPSFLRNMKPQYFAVISRTGAIGIGDFPYPEWHKRERENILAAVGVKVEYGEPLEEAQYKGTFMTVSDKEHSEIIRLCVEEGMGMKDIAAKLGRSSRTPHEHIQHKHNASVERSGFCAACKRVGSPYFNKKAFRGKV